MFVRFENNPTSWACFGVPGGNGPRTDRLRRPHQPGHDGPFGTTIVGFGWLTVFLGLWSLWLLSSALPGQARARSTDVGSAPIAKSDEATTAGLRHRGQDARDVSDRPGLNTNKRLRKRRARFEDKESSKSRRGLVASWSEPVSWIRPRVLVSMDSGPAIAGPDDCTRSPILRC